jgi:hypothetical protein
LENEVKKVVRIKPKEKESDKITYTDKGWGVSDYVAKSVVKNSNNMKKPTLLQKSSKTKILHINNQKIKKSDKTVSKNNDWDDDNEWVEFK